MPCKFSIAAFAAVALTTLCVSPSPCRAQINDGVPKPLQEVGVDEHLEALLPLDARFVDENRRQIKLGDLFPGDRPVIVSLNYSDCPMLCNLQLNGLVQTLQQIDFTPGVDYDIISASINPREKPIRAKQTEQRYLQLYGRPETAGGWHFLTSNQENIDRLAEAIGFRYNYVPERDEYAHAAVFVICTPDGRISRYIYGIEFPPQTVRLSLVEAGEGKIGATLDRILLFCFHYDATAGRYGPVAQNIMKLGGAVTVVGLGVFLFPVWRRKRRRAAQAAADAASVAPPAAETDISSENR